MKRPFVWSLLFLVLGCSTVPVRAQPDPNALPTPVSAPAAAEPTVPTVILVSVDGLRADMVAEMPVLNGLRRKGSWTLEAQAPHPSVTVVSHAAMFTGIGPDKNGVDKDGPPKSRAFSWRPLKQPTVFQLLRRHRIGATAAIYQKTKFAGLLPIEDVSFSLETTDTALAVSETCRLIAKPDDVNDPRPQFIFLHLNALDGAGHKHGWMSKEQKQAAAKTDADIRTLVYCLVGARDGNLKRPFRLVITSDHGGHDRTHGSTDPVDVTIPWIAIGDGIKEGHEIEAPVRLMDTAPTVLMMLDPDRYVMEGKPLLEIFE